ncbi:Type 4 prepilin-like proteins leader peptide-processing enzyme (Includes: Leader peptidase; N-methyltransferase) [Candidatus Desulfosporosinus infrequens]|uniref:Prepilin leader peptidase/N-methyltransferase n=1 Tax=Candidatus Desulfosporosinus infrequens TaxID=2043169 RepID=A0A2U3K036_9FIRM|nr:Type 4 prepilin-like proteins leader peptide-processing enzyme (Includes: Leader peptidase; N-methyltransferase) [Candidatus Desulfosporosinus infrequens]
MYLISLTIGLLGLLIGSFLNVVIFRVPRGESIVAPGSHCPACCHALRAWELLPLLSFLIQKGRCSNCQTCISWRYPVVELLTGILFFITASVGLSTETHPVRLLMDLVLVAVLTALSFIDLDTFRLPDVLTLPLLGIGLLGAFLIPGSPSGCESVLGALSAGGLFWGIARVYPQGMGFGDVKLVAALGAFLGFPTIFLAVFMGSFVGAFMGILLFVTGQKRLQEQIPFGPYLALGAIFALFWGARIFAWYWAWI